MSLVRLVREPPVLREAALNIALVFATFNAIWVTLVFLLESPPYNISSYFMQNRSSSSCKSPQFVLPSKRRNQ